ncbi:MAG: RHS repeat-associated core domain-containing protein [bacterium]
MNKVDVSGEITRLDYAPFGEDFRPTSERYKFTGKEDDVSTDLYYYNARYYDPAIGRFITEDSAKDGINWYVYCRNSPFRYVDLDGLAAMEANTTWTRAGKLSWDYSRTYSLSMDYNELVDMRRYLESISDKHSRISNFITGSSIPLAFIELSRNKSITIALATGITGYAYSTSSSQLMKTSNNTKVFEGKDLSQINSISFNLTDDSFFRNNVSSSNMQISWKGGDISKIDVGANDILSLFLSALRLNVEEGFDFNLEYDYELANELLNKYQINH